MSLPRSRPRAHSSIVLSPSVPTPSSPAPQVVLALVNNQVQLQSNIVGPQTWCIVARICLQGAQAALNELSKEGENTEGPRIVVPTFQVKGGVAG